MRIRLHRVFLSQERKSERIYKRGHQKMAKCFVEKKRGNSVGPLEWFEHMIQNCYEYATAAKGEGKKIVGIMCEYTPRELIMAAGGVPVCLCGGSAEMIEPAQEDLPANLCPLIKSTYGYYVQKANPFLEMADMLVAETTCDGKKKMYELMAGAKEMAVLELCQKSDDLDAKEHWKKELVKFKKKLEEEFEVEITDEKIRQALRVMNRERRLRRKLAELMKGERPVITGRELLDFKSIISGIDADLEHYEKAIEILKAKECGCEDTKKIRVMLTGVPVVHGAERIVEIIEEHGGLIVCMDNCTGLKPILDDVDERCDDPMEALAEKYFSLPCSVMTPNERRLEVIEKLAAEYRVDCIIELVWQACLTYDVESYFVKQLAEERLKIPYLKIETDYSPSDSARIATRVDALFEMIGSKLRKKKTGS
jgi:benzoyl-CoA reductase/2-hydroxyglutaryl-CoA dehydratase subunit BcrC/BadD/HgdB